MAVFLVRTMTEGEVVKGSLIVTKLVTEYMHSSLFHTIAIKSQKKGGQLIRLPVAKLVAPR